MIKISNIDIAFKEQLIHNGSIVLPRGVITGIVGKSGMGKTALLEVIGLLTDKTYSYEFEGTDISNISEAKKSQIQRNDISFIFQDIQLFESLTLRENIEFYASLVNKTIDETEINGLLDDMNLSLSLDTDVKTMSIGERQRLSILCGLVKGASLFIFDEPTAYLDRKNKLMIIDILKKLTRDMNKIVVVASHDKTLIDAIDRVYTIKDKQLLLTKDIAYSDDSTVGTSTALDSHVLKSFSKLNRKSHRYIYIAIGVVLGLVIGCSVFSYVYSYEFNKMFNSDLLNLLNNRITVAKEDQSLITPMEYSRIEADLDNDMYPYFEVEGTINYGDSSMSVVICPYQKFENLDSKLLYDNGESDIYITYETYRKIGDYKNCECIFGNTTFSLSTNKVLKDSFDNREYIYVPFDQFKEILNENDIDIYNISIEKCVVRINSADDIKTISSQLDSTYVASSISLDFDTRISMLKTINPKTMFIIDILVVIMFIAYHVYTIILNNKEIALLKSLGLSHKDLMGMKRYELFNDFIYSFIFGLIVLAILMFVTSMFSLLGIVLFIAHILIIAVILYICYYIFIKKYTVAILLRNE